MKFRQFVLNILSGNEFLRKSKAIKQKHTNVRKMTCNNPKLDLVNMNAYIKLGEIMSNPVFPIKAYVNNVTLRAGHSGPGA